MAAARDDDAAPAAPVPTQPPGTALELAAVLMLTAGSFFPVVGWLVGVVLLWSSRRWTVTEKLLGTLVVPLGPGGVLVLGVAALPAGMTCNSGVLVDADGTETFNEETCTGFAFPLWIGIPLLLVMLVAPVVMAVWLYRRAHARAALGPPVPERASSSSPWGGLEIAAVLLLSLGTFVVPVVGPLVGLVLAWCSPRWSNGEKGVATSLPLLSLVLLGAHYVQPLGGGLMPFGVGALALGALGPLAAAVFLAVRLSRRR